jgi:hypothetical protein
VSKNSAEEAMHKISWSGMIMFGYPYIKIVRYSSCKHFEDGCIRTSLTSPTKLQVGYMKILLLISLSFYCVYILLEFNFGKKTSFVKCKHLLHFHVVLIAMYNMSNLNFCFVGKNEHNLTCVDVLPFTPLLFFSP